MPPQATAQAPYLHRFGIALSGLCLIHCLALPWLLASLPVVALAALPEALRDSEWLHAALIAPVVLVSGPALWRAGGARAGVLVAGLAALIGALFVGSERLETGLTVAGAMSLLVAHWATLHQRKPRGL